MSLLRIGHLVTVICSVIVAVAAVAPYLLSRDGGNDPPVELRTVAPTQPAPAVRAPVCLQRSPAPVYFDSDSSSLSEDAVTTLAALAVAISAAECVHDGAGVACPPAAAVVDVDGHADERPTARAGGNDALALERAGATGDTLARIGVRVGAVRGWGASVPATGPVPDHRSDEQRWRDDRRVTMTLRC